MPGISASQALVASRMNSGTLDTGTDTSFFTLAPSRFCASECSSRSRQTAARCVSDSAMTASDTTPSANATSNTDSSVIRSRRIRSRRGELYQDIKWRRRGKRQHRPFDVPQHELCAEA